MQTLDRSESGQLSNDSPKTARVSPGKTRLPSWGSTTVQRWKWRKAAQVLGTVRSESGRDKQQAKPVLSD